MPRDHVLDADRGSSDQPTQKQGVMLDLDEVAERRKDRAGSRELDGMLEGMPGITRAGKDSQRAYPRDTTAPVDHERKRRKLPQEGEVRRPMSARQRDVRSAMKNRSQDSMPATEYRSMAQLLGQDGATWVELNDRLSDVAGDRQHLSEEDQKLSGRIDRTIQRFEQSNDRGHVVYVNMRTPRFINRSNLAGFAANQFQPVSTVEFDRYTGGAHTMHEIEPDTDAQRTVVFEIQTRRGMYLGGSRRVDDTQHLLPRGTAWEVVGSHTATYERPDGSTGERVVVQLIDHDPSHESEDR